MGRQISANVTYKKSFEDEVPMLNELPNATAVATVTSPEVMPDTAFIEKSAPTEQSADQLSLQPTDSEKSKVPNAMSLFFVKPHEPVFVNIDQHGPTVAGLYTIEPAMLQRGGTQRYFQPPRLKPLTKDAFSVIKELILILLLVAGYSPLLPSGAINRNSKFTLNYWAYMTSVLMLAVVVSLIIKLIILNRLKVNSVWELILEYNFAYFVTPSKVRQKFEKAQEIASEKQLNEISLS